jgi:hypothetical protein
MTPTEAMDSRYVEQPSRRAIRFRRVEDDLRIRVDDGSNHVGKAVDREVFASTDVDVVRLTVPPHQEHARVCKVVDVQELADLRSVALATHPSIHEGGSEHAPLSVRAAHARAAQRPVAQNRIGKPERLLVVLDDELARLFRAPVEGTGRAVDVERAREHVPRHSGLARRLQRDRATKDVRPIRLEGILAGGLDVRDAGLVLDDVATADRLFDDRRVEDVTDDANLIRPEVERGNTVEQTT